jgi:hypothetical protein
MTGGVTLVGLLDISRLEEHLEKLKKDKVLRPSAEELIQAFAELALSKLVHAAPRTLAERAQCQ